MVPGPLSARHSSVQGIPSSVTAGVPADFAIIPSDQYGNRGAAGGALHDTMHTWRTHTLTLLYCERLLLQAGAIYCSTPWFLRPLPFGAAAQPESITKRCRMPLSIDLAKNQALPSSLLILAGGKFLAGLICGEDTVAVHVVEREVGGGRAAFASLTAKHAGPWGLGVYVQMSDGQCVPRLASVCTLSRLQRLAACASHRTCWSMCCHVTARMQLSSTTLEEEI